MRAELVYATELGPVDTQRWRELAARAVEPNPFFEPEYVLPLARSLGELDRLRLLVVRDDGGWRGCLPVHLAPRWRRLPLRSLATWRGYFLYGLLGTPLLCRQSPERALAELLGALPSGHEGVALGVLEWVPADGFVGGALAGLLAERRPSPVRFERFERATVHRRPQPTYLEETLRPKHRRELGRQRRKLAEELGGEPTMVDRSGEEAAYEQFVALEAAAKKADRGTTLSADPSHVAFFTEMCREFANLGRLQLLDLQAGGQTVAMKCNLLAGDTIFLFKIAFDERWAAYSPGVQLELEMLKFFHDQTEVQTMDSCADPRNPMINRLWPDRRTIDTYFLPADNLRGRAARPALAAIRTLRDQKLKRRDG